MMKKKLPMFELFVDLVADDVAKIFRNDRYARKLHAIKRARDAGKLTSREDRYALERLAHACAEFAKRADEWAEIFGEASRRAIKNRQEEN